MPARAGPRSRAGTSNAADGDTISIAAGTYSVSDVSVAKNLSMVGTGGATVLSGGGAGTALTATAGARLGFSSIAIGG